MTVRIWALAALLSATAAGAWAQDATVAGRWRGVVDQNKGAQGYDVLLLLTSKGGKTAYPELNCSGELTRVGAANGYVFYAETITSGGVKQGGGCIDGTLTVKLARGRLHFGWVGAFEGETYSAWSVLDRYTQ